MAYQTGILPALKDWRLAVVEVPGWQTRGSSLFDPRGHVLHHDVIRPMDSVPDLILAGRPEDDLPGPLANFWLRRDGTVFLVAAGKANHAGEGHWKNLSGNSSVWGTEMNNLGVAADEWPEEQLEAMARLAAATAEFSGFPVANVCFHREWAPDRKIDPHTLDPDAFRRHVELTTKEGLFMPGDIDRLIDVERGQGRKTRATIVNQFAKLRRALTDDDDEKREAQKDVDASQKVIDEKDDDG